ncbi:MAG: Xaa-Pro peptidase family protein [Proteobacteria bacterium]|nr:Xaa-Pro peptidase family protein [Pseudomonadota bacterium]MDA0960524.1 Xaa-Pro peptidase family protein [Pseudomonadota bacterium]
MDKTIIGSNRKIDPSRRVHLKADLTPDDNNRVEIGPTALAFDEWHAAGISPPDLHALRSYRLSRLQAQIRQHDSAGLLLFDPLNIRYASDCTNMQLWIAHNPARAVFVPPEGKMILWDFHNCEHLSAHLPLIGELRGGASFFYFETGDHTARAAKDFATQIVDVMAHHAGTNKRLAVDRIEHVGYAALTDLGVEVLEGQVLTEHARSIKNDNELNAMRCAIHACERAVDEMYEIMRPGLSETELWAALHAGNIKRGGEWIETRILASGPRTNPWFQECGPRIMQTGDLMAFDTDLVGTYGYCCDISRTWIVGDAVPTDRQKHLYQIAYDHVMSNIGLIEAGMSFADMTRIAHRLPEAFRPLRYGVLAHGVGLCDEYPSVRYPEDVEAHGYGGNFEVGMTLCVEAYVGAVGGVDGVKLEEQVLVTDRGAVPLSTYRYEDQFLA